MAESSNPLGANAKVDGGMVHPTAAPRCDSALRSGGPGALVAGRPPLIAEAQPTATQQPGQAALDDPAVPPQPLTRFDAASRNPGRNAPGAQRSPQHRVVVPLIGVQFGWPFPGSPGLAARPDDRWNGIHEGQELGGIMGVGGRQADGERNALPVHDQVVVGAGFAAIRGIGAGRLAPFWPGRSRCPRSPDANQ